MTKNKTSRDGEASSKLSKTNPLSHEGYTFVLDTKIRIDESELRCDWEARMYDMDEDGKSLSSDHPLSTKYTAFARSLAKAISQSHRKKYPSTNLAPDPPTEIKSIEALNAKILDDMLLWPEGAAITGGSVFGVTADPCTDIQSHYTGRKVVSPSDTENF